LQLGELPSAQGAVQAHGNRFDSRAALKQRHPVDQAGTVLLD
jgi:hypothetical protein